MNPLAAYQAESDGGFPCEMSILHWTLYMKERCKKQHTAAAVPADCDGDFVRHRGARIFVPESNGRTKTELISLRSKKNNTSTETRIHTVKTRKLQRSRSLTLASMIDRAGTGPVLSHGHAADSSAFSITVHYTEYTVQ